MCIQFHIASIGSGIHGPQVSSGKEGVDTETRTVQVCSASERANADGDPELQGGVDGGKQVSVPEEGLVAWMTGSME